MKKENNRNIKNNKGGDSMNGNIIDTSPEKNFLFEFEQSLKEMKTMRQGNDKKPSWKELFQNKDKTGDKN